MAMANFPPSEAEPTSRSFVKSREGFFLKQPRWVLKGSFILMEQINRIQCERSLVLFEPTKWASGEANCPLIANFAILAPFLFFHRFLLQKGPSSRPISLTNNLHKASEHTESPLWMEVLHVSQLLSKMYVHIADDDIKQTKHADQCEMVIDSVQENKIDQLDLGQLQQSTS